MPVASNNKFNKGAKPATAAAKPKASRYGTFKPREEGPPMLRAIDDKEPAEYRVRYESAEACTAQKPGGQNTIKTYVEVLSGDGPTPVGTRALVLHMQSQYGRADFSEQVVATAGYDGNDPADVEAYTAFDPDGFFFAACEGDSNDYNAEAAAMVGRVVDVQVSRGNDDGKGGYYRKYRWAPVADDDADQDTNPKIERAAAE